MPRAYSVEQVAPYRFWPSGDSRALAVLRFSPEELSRRYRLRFEEDYDDLDCYRLAAIRLPDGNQAWLMHYRGDPEFETTDVDVAALSSATLRQVIAVLGLSSSDILWTSPLLAAEAGSAF